MGRRKYDDDDGRVIAKMNVEGMPWYSPPQSTLTNSSGDDAPPQLTRKETFWVIMGAMRAGLVIAGVASLALIITCLIFLR